MLPKTHDHDLVAGRRRRCGRGAILVALLLGAPRLGAWGPPELEVSASYVFMQPTDYGDRYPVGWLASGGLFFLPFVSAVAEVGGSYRSVVPTGNVPVLHASVYEFMAGPRVVSRHGALRPFGQILFGTARTGNNYSGYEMDATWQLGGGVDIDLRRSVALRVQADYRSVLPAGANVTYVRVGTGIVLKIK